MAPDFAQKNVSKNTNQCRTAWGGGGGGGVRSVNLPGLCITCTNKFTLFYIPLISDAVDTLLCFVRLDGIELTALFIRYVNTTCTAQQYLIKYLCYACNN